MKKIKIKPAPGRKVRDPYSGDPLPESGALVPLTAYWQRRLADGDVIEIDVPAQAAAPEQTAKKTKE